MKPNSLIINKIYRYPGAHSFQTDQKDIFFGREEELSIFCDFVALNRITVLFSKSGLGKSSFLNAGVIPHYQGNKVFQPVYIRFKPYNNEIDETPIFITRRNVVKDKFRKTFLDKVINNEQSLWHDIKEQQIANKGKLSLLLIFDQFEELFEYPENLIQDFKEQLAESMFTTIPQRYRNQLSEGKGPKLDENQLELLHSPFSLQVIFSIRSDRMHLLNKLKDYFHTILSNCYELKPLTREEAEDAIINPALISNKKFESHIFSYTYGAVNKIINYLTKNKKLSIESFQLQVLCHALEQKVIEKKLEEISENNLGDLDDITQNYYFNQLSTIKDETQRLHARKLIEEGLIFEQQQRRISLLEGIIARDYKVDGLLLQKLIETRLLRSEQLHDGAFAYELSHDSMIAPILKAKAARQVEEEKDRLKEDANKARKKQNQAMAFTLVLFFLATIALIGIGIAYHESNQKNDLKKELIQRIADNLHKDIQGKIYDLNYEEAYVQLQKAEDFVKLDTNMRNQFLEFAYYESCSERIDSANALIQRLGQLLGDTRLSTIRLQQEEDVYKLIRQISPAFAENLKERYFPKLIAIDGDTTLGFAEKEITVWQFMVYCRAKNIDIYDTKSNWDFKGDLPIVKVDWYDAIEYANWLSQKINLEPYYLINKFNSDDKNKWVVNPNPSSNGFRLPKKDEWLFAANGGKNFKNFIFSGSDTLDKVGWYLENSRKGDIPEPNKVGILQANTVGLYDMSGNLWEWCEEWDNQEENLKIVAGGAFNMDANSCTVNSFDNADAYTPKRNDYNTIGVRLCRNFK